MLAVFSRQYKGKRSAYGDFPGLLRKLPMNNGHAPPHTNPSWCW